MTEIYKTEKGKNVSRLFQAFSISRVLPFIKYKALNLDLIILIELRIEELSLLLCHIKYFASFCLYLIF